MAARARTGRGPSLEGGTAAILGKRSARGMISLDPRTIMGILVAASAAAFMEKSLPVECCLVGAMALVQALSGRVKMALGFAVAYGALVCVLSFALPYAGGVAATMFTISLTFARKIYLCLMAGTLLVADSSVHRIATALARLKLPPAVLIPLTVTLRYFPTLKEEARHIRDAMALRDIPAQSKAECFVMPLVMSAASTADELSRAATCRGIENPAPSTDTERLAMGAADWAVLAAAAMALAAVALAGGSF